MINWQTAARQARAREYPHCDSLVLGSWGARVASDSRRYIDFLRAHFRQEAAGSRPVEGAARIELVECSPGHPIFANNCSVPEDTLEVENLGTRHVLAATRLLRAIATRAPGKERITLFLLGDNAEDSVLTTHLSIAFRRLLLECGMFYLHAGAVETNAQVSLFIGEKGSGKSTVCLRLAQEGGCLLSDDHVLVKKCRMRYLVSGSDRIARITSDTEHFLFRQPLGVEARDFAGVQKKEFATARLFPCSQFKDHPVHNIFFPRVGRRFSVRPLPEAAATVRLIAGNRHAFRFKDRLDYDSLLDFFSGMVAGKQVFDLELSPDPADLNQLVAFLRNG